MKAVRYSASAGSGKTYTLTEIYLNRALQSPRAFAGILALTFTNKAANELKIRILKALKRRIEDGSAAGAEAVLFQILHHYEQFQVGTIDSFFQNLFSRFAYEAQLPYGMAIELDEEVIFQDVLEEGLLNLPDELWPILLNMLLEEAKSNKGKGWRPLFFTREKIVKQLFKEFVLTRLISGEHNVWNDDAIRNAEQALEKYKAQLIEPIFQTAKAILDQAHANGFAQIVAQLPEKDKFKKQWRLVEDVVLKQKYPEKTYSSHEKGTWRSPPKACSKAMLSEFEPLLIAFFYSFSSSSKGNFSLASQCLKNLRASRLLVHFRQTHTRVNEEENRFYLEEVKYMLRGVIGDSEVPYLYERMGTKLNTLLVDEFQDTNQIQWEVMQPLAKSILENRGHFVAVGDVKQSIYGWRGGDSSLFSEKIANSLAPIPLQTETLAYNYRSEGLIVNFNNQIFHAIPELFQDHLREKLATDDHASYWAGVFRDNYADVIQKLPEGKAATGGFVEFRVEFLNKNNSENDLEDDRDENTDEHSEEKSGNWSWLIAEIYALLEDGIPLDDIAVLVRRNNEIDEIVQALDEERRLNPEKGSSLRFSASQESKRKDHLFFDFLATCMVRPAQFDAFRWEKIRVLASNLGIASIANCFSIQAEKAQELVQLGKGKDVLSHFLALIHLLQLDQKTEYLKHLADFENLLFDYLQKHSTRYPDFDHWWKEKGGQSKSKASESEGGIQIMTIHKSKGLDFGVVIIPSKIPNSANWYNEEFWFSSEKEPWNSFPFMFAKGQKEFKDSDLASEFIADIYIKKLEELNNWYVACTRPRYGLIVHVRGKNSKKRELSQLPVLMLDVLENKKVAFLQLHPESTYEELLDEDGSGTIRFRAGQRKAVLERQIEKSNHFSVGYTLKPSLQPEWVIPESQSAQQLEGLAFHKVLENCAIQEAAEIETRKISLSLDNPSVDKNKVKEEINQLMKECTAWDLFSTQNKAYTEREIWSNATGLLRVDRIESQSNAVVVVDFKTGEKSEDHYQQLSQYQTVLSQTLKLPVKAAVIYSQTMEKIEL